MRRLLLHVLGIQAVLGLQLMTNQVHGAELAPASTKVQMQETADGVRFGFVGSQLDGSAPLVVLLNSHPAEEAFKDPFGGRCAELLLADGYCVATIDLPCHGEEHRTTEREELSGWADRAAKDENFVAEVLARLKKVLDDLIERGLVDSDQIILCGTSRGGFVACHFAARDPRVRCVVAFAPVTDLSALVEFKNLADSRLVSSLHLTKLANRLAGRPIWIIIGDQDERVGTENTKQFAELLKESAEAKGRPSAVHFEIVHEPRGHTLPPHVGDDAAEWVRQRLSKHLNN